MIFSKKPDACTLQNLTAVTRALDRTHIVMWCNPDGNVLEVNDKLLSAAGVTINDIRGRHYTTLLSLDTAGGEDWAVVQDGRELSGLARHNHRNGNTLYFDMTFQPVPGKEAVERVLATGTDVTERMVADANTNSFIRAVDRAHAIIEFDLQGIILTANENFLTTMGYSLEEIQDKHHRIFVEPSYASSQEYQDFWDTLARGEFHAGEYRRLGKTGNTVWIQATYSPVLDSEGVPYKIVKFASDITEEKLRSERFEGQAVGISRSQAIVEFELDGTIVSANEKFLEATGYTQEEVVGQHHKIFVDRDYAASPQYAEFWRELSEGSFKAETFKRLTKHGDAIWLQASYNPVFDIDGKPCRIIKYASVVTHWKSALDRVSVALQSLSEGDLTVRLPASATNEFNDTSLAFNSTVERLQSLVDVLPRFQSG